MYKNLLLKLILLIVLMFFSVGCISPFKKNSRSHRYHRGIKLKKNSNRKSKRPKRSLRSHSTRRSNMVKRSKLPTYPFFILFAGTIVLGGGIVFACKTGGSGPSSQNNYNSIDANDDTTSTSRVPHTNSSSSSLQDPMNEQKNDIDAFTSRISQTNSSSSSLQSSSLSQLRRERKSTTTSTGLKKKKMLRTIDEEIEIQYLDGIKLTQKNLSTIAKCIRSNYIEDIQFQAIVKKTQDASLVESSIIKDRLSLEVKEKLFEICLKDKFFDRSLGTMYGMVVADAVGASVEFTPLSRNKNHFVHNDAYSFDNNVYHENSLYYWKGGKEKKPNKYPKSIIKNARGKFVLLGGQWTDDASMGLCMADSLIIKGGFSGFDIRKRFWNWWNSGYNNAFRFDKERHFGRTSVGLGGNISASLDNMLKENENGRILSCFTPTDEKKKDASGNGSLMRLAPIPIFFRNDIDKAMKFAKKSSYTTHPGYDAVEACALLSFIIVQAINNKEYTNIDKFLIENLKKYKSLLQKELNKFNNDKKRQESIKKIIQLIDSESKDKEISWNWKCGKYVFKLKIIECLKKRKDRYNGYKSTAEYFGSYSIDGLAMALNSVYNSIDLASAIENAVNLLGDADSTGSIAGQMAGAFYGLNNRMLESKAWKNLMKWDKLDAFIKTLLLYYGRIDNKKVADIENNKIKEINADLENKTIYHYQNDPLGMNGEGWSCVHNNIQTLFSSAGLEVPRLKDLKEYFSTSKQANNKHWIEPANAKKYLDEKWSGYFTSDIYYFDKKCNSDKYVREFANKKYTYNVINKVEELTNKIIQHLNDTKLPIIMDDGAYSYSIIGVKYKYDLKNDKNEIISLKIAEPHCFSDGGYTKIEYEQKYMIKEKEFGDFIKKKWMMLFATRK